MLGHVVEMKLPSLFGGNNLINMLKTLLMFQQTEYFFIQMVQRVFEDLRNLQTPSGFFKVVFLCKSNWSFGSFPAEPRVKRCACTHKAGWLSPSGCSVGATGDGGVFWGTAHYAELQGAVCWSACEPSCWGWWRQEERAERRRGRRVEWHHNATSAGPGGSTGPRLGLSLARQHAPCCLTAFSSVLTRSWKREAYRKQTVRGGATWSRSGGVWTEGWGVKCDMFSLS